MLPNSQCMGKGKLDIKMRYNDDDDDEENSSKPKGAMPAPKYEWCKTSSRPSQSGVYLGDRQWGNRN